MFKSGDLLIPVRKRMYGADTYMHKQSRYERRDDSSLADESFLWKENDLAIFIKNDKFRTCYDNEIMIYLYGETFWVHEDFVELAEIECNNESR